MTVFRALNVSFINSLKGGLLLVCSVKTSLVFSLYEKLITFFH